MVSKRVIDRLRSLGSNLVTATRLWALQDLAFLAWTANFDATGFILRCGYSGIGRPPRDPAAMFRAWILATSLGISSPTQWADRLGTDPVLAILCGFEPTDTPSATTFVDFMTRLTRTMRARARVHCPHRKRGKGPGKGKKRPLHRADVLRACRRIYHASATAMRGPCKRSSLASLPAPRTAVSSI